MINDKPYTRLQPNQPIISIIMPTYNQANFLPQALDSIFSQTLTNIELIVVNDGSTDHTENVLSDYQKKHQFTIINQSNQGLPKALNTGFRSASGRFYSWTSSDNILLPEMVEKLHRVLVEDTEIDIVYADWYFIDGSGRILSDYHTLDFDRQLLLQFNFVHCCFLFRREVYEKIGGYDPEYIYSEDWEFWIRASRFFTMKHVPEALYLYRIHSGSMTTEIVHGTANQRVRYPEFSARLRRLYPLDWYLGKIKKQWIKLKLGYDPLDRWLK